MRNKLVYILILPLFLFFLSSCVNLKYTDYGRPLDFLKAKNTYVRCGTSEIDTASLYCASKEQPLEWCDSLIKDPKDAVETENKFAYVKIQEEEESILESKEEEISESIETLVSGSLDYKRKRFRKLVNLSNHPTPWPPEWWTNMWSNFWNWVLKWVLIALAVLVVLALLLWGIYALISVLANPTVAGIVIFCIIMLFYLLIEFS